MRAVRSSERRASAASVEREDARREQRRVGGSADRHRRDRHAGRHLRDREQRVEAFEACDSTGTPITGSCVLVGDHARQVRRAAGAGDDRAQTARPAPQPRSGTSGRACGAPRRLSVSYGTPSSCSIVAAARIVSRSDVEPMMIPTSGVSIALAFGSPEVSPSTANARARCVSPSGSITGRGAARCTCGSASIPGEIADDLARIADARLRQRPLLPALGRLPARTATAWTARCWPGSSSVMELIAAAGLRAMPTLFCGHMSGVNWLPSWTLDPPRPKAGAFAPSPRTGESPYGSGDLYDGALLRSAASARARSRRRAARASRPCSRGISATSSATSASPHRPPTRASGANGSPTISQSRLGHPVTGGIHGEDLTYDRHIRPSSICEPWAFATMHGYSVYSEFAREPHRYRSRAVSGRADGVDVGQAGALQRVRQPDVPAGEAIAVRSFSTARRTVARNPGRRSGPRCVRLPQRSRNGRLRDGRARSPARAAAGWVRIGGAGPTTTMTLRETPPFDRAPHELTFGIVRSDGSDEARGGGACGVRAGSAQRRRSPRSGRCSSRPTMPICRVRPTMPTLDFWSSIFEDDPGHRCFLGHRARACGSGRTRRLCGVRRGA